MLLLSSGPQVPPYSHNGFVATLEFYEKGTTTETSVIPSSHAIDYASGTRNTRKFNYLLFPKLEFRGVP